MIDMTTAPIELVVILDDVEVGWQLAQFCKRLCFNDFYKLTEPHLSEDERNARAYQMMRGVSCVQQALHDAYLAPR